MPRLALYLLGSPRIELDNKPIAVDRHKATALLVYLAVTGESHSRDKLADLFWPKQAKPRTQLSQTLWVLRKALDSNWLVADRDRIGLAQEGDDFWLDVNYFLGQLAACQTHSHPVEEPCPTCLDLLIRAVDCYTGDFMTGFTLLDSPEFDEWHFFQVEHLRQQLITTLDRLTHGYIVRGQYEVAIAPVQRRLALDQLHEAAYQQLMRLYAWTGQPRAALHQYEICRRVLQEELNAIPDIETTALYELIKARQEPPRPDIEREPQTITMGRDFGTPAPRVAPQKAEDFGESIFVAREAELARLVGFLDQSLKTQQGQVVFITGEAGSGKTALVQEFARQALSIAPDLIVSGGNCNAYIGVGDPYLPFREVLGLLTGNLDVRWASEASTQMQAPRLSQILPTVFQAIVAVGPDLVGTFISGQGLLEHAVAFAQDQMNDLPWLTQLEKLVTQKVATPTTMPLQQRNLFEQYTQVLHLVARQRPLVLILDDLQWADIGSTSLLFHLGRQLTQSRILIVGIYRPADVALGRGEARHPLEPLVNEFQRSLGDIRVDLRQTTGQEFVNALIDAEPNQLDQTFRTSLYKLTHGHPLFTVEMLRSLEKRGDLTKDEAGRWVVQPTLAWDTLPAQIEGVIEERISRLPDTLQEMLKIASVAGEDFVAEVIAHIQAVNERMIIRQLSSTLDKQHNLVKGQGSERLDEQRLSHYRFQHNLFQRYLYHNLDDIELSYLHEAVGTKLEQLYAGYTTTIAPQLARHFEAAGLATKAITYLHQAGQRALRLAANEEAIAHFFAAIALLDHLPENLERTQQELDLRISLGPALIATKGYAAPQVQQTYTRARALCHQLGQTPHLYKVFVGLWIYYFVRAELNVAHELATELWALARPVQDSIVRLQARRVMGNTLCVMGQFAPARGHLEAGIARYQAHPHDLQSMLDYIPA